MSAKRFHYYLGLDLGQSQDNTALSIIEEPVWVSPSFQQNWPTQWGEPPHVKTGWVSPAEMAPHDLEAAIERVREEGRPPNPALSVRHLERFPIGTRYPDVVERVKELSDRRPLYTPGYPTRTVMLVDKTGVGAAVLDSFHHAGVGAVAVTIHGGSSVSGDPQRPGYRVPKRDLVSAVQLLLQNRRLKIAESLPEADTLRRELRNFRVKIDPKTAHDSYEHWREQEHDDLVLSVAMAAWFREYWNQRLERHYAKQQRRSPMAG